MTDYSNSLFCNDFSLDEFKELFPIGSFIKIMWEGNRCTISKIKDYHPSNDGDSIMAVEIEYGIDSTKKLRCNELFGVQNNYVCYPLMSEIIELNKTYKDILPLRDKSDEELRQLIATANYELYRRKRDK